VRLFYRVVGTGRDTVVVLHGGPGFTMEYFADDLAPLAERHSLLFYDQRGTGRSSLVSDSAALDGQRFAEDLEAVRQHFGIARLTLLGDSWGAGVAALYATRYPERVGRLLVVGPIPARRAELQEAFVALEVRRDSVTRRRMQEWRQARLANPGDAAACRAYVLWFSAFFGDPAAAGRSRGDFCAGTPEALRNKMASVDRFTAASLGDWDWQPALRTVTAPALVIHGTSDPLPVPSARRWAAALPNGRLLLLQGIGHFPYLEVPERFFDSVNEFLQGRWPADAQTVAAP
jgi:proline iminopeptidase